jgi:hypothetical protein
LIWDLIGKDEGGMEEEWRRNEGGRRRKEGGRRKDAATCMGGPHGPTEHALVFTPGDGRIVEEAARVRARVAFFFGGF